MKKRIIAVAILMPILAVSSWFFWPEFRVLTLCLPKDAESVQKLFGVSVFDVAGVGDNAGNIISAYRLGAWRILWLQHAPGESITGAVVSVNVLYQIKGLEREMITNNYSTVPLETVRTRPKRLVKHVNTRRKVCARKIFIHNI